MKIEKTPPVSIKKVEESIKPVEVKQRREPKQKVPQDIIDIIQWMIERIQALYRKNIETSTRHEAEGKQGTPVVRDIKKVEAWLQKVQES